MQVRGSAATQGQPTARQHTAFPARYTDCLPVVAHSFDYLNCYPTFRSEALILVNFYR